MSADTFDRPLPNSYWVLPGKLLAGEHPRRATETPVAARERLRQLMDMGIDCFIDLTLPNEFESYELELPTGVLYLRQPIRDHSIPARPEHMIEILGHLERTLAVGRRVYLHCHAGIGRTGTVAGCLLIERGETGGSALNTLNRLWQQCERSRTWPYVPETDEQIDFVRNWVPTASRGPIAQLAANSIATLKGKAVAATPRRKAVRKPQARADAPQSSAPVQGADRGLRDRYQGALLGLAVGDALAAATQGRKVGSFEPVDAPIGGGPFELPVGAWSDDTAMALCVADSLLDRARFDVRDQVERFHRWQQQGYLSATGKCVGITANTARAIAAAQWRRQVFPGSHDPKQLDPEVLSRVAPAVLFTFGSPHEALRVVSDAARITCQAPRAVDACQLFAALVYGALADQPKEQVLHPGSALLNIDSLHPKAAALLHKSITDTERPPHSGGTVLDALAAALWAFRTTQNFRDGALRAANLGGHSDVIAAAYGQLAGAYYGGQAIPAAWRNGLIQKGLISDFADRLFTHARRGPIG